MESVPQICAHEGCHKRVTSSQAKARFCSRLCAKREHTRLNNAKQRAVRNSLKFDKQCGRTGCATIIPASRYSNAIYCSTRCTNMQYHRSHPGYHTAKAAVWRKANREKFNDITKRAQHIRRTARISAKSEYFLVAEIAERDKWVCGICSKSIDPCLQHPHPMSKQLDHIVPISRGGAHTRANTQIAHKVCNNRKGAGLR